MKILIIGAEPFSLLQFRGDLIKELVSLGYEVVAMANNASDTQIAKLEDYGARYIDYPVSRTGLNPFGDIQTLYSLLSHFRLEEPDYVLSYTIKPVIWGSIASKFFPKLKFVGMVTGLGYAFGRGGFLRSFVRVFATALYKVALASADAVIFQNPDNRQTFVDQKLVSACKTHVIQGSGVNLAYFPYSEYQMDGRNLCFLMVARLLRDKGVREFIAAAEKVKAIHNNVDFVLVGPLDSSPDAIPLEKIIKYDRTGVISYKGAVSDVRTFMIDSSVYVLPSYHEGMPRTVLEAMAVGRPIITTDVPGCRETVSPGVNGWLVSKGDSDDLAEKILWFVDSPNEIKKMGQQSRDMVSNQFDVKQVNKDIINIVTNS